jgi:hypothetical protein
MSWLSSSPATSSVGPSCRRCLTLCGRERFGCSTYCLSTKEADGTVGSVDLTGLGLELDPAFRDLDGQLAGGLLDADDVDIAAEGLEPNTSVALIIWENSWAAHFVSTLRDADAKVVDQARIPSDVVIAALEAAANDNG